MCIHKRQSIDIIIDCIYIYIYIGVFKNNMVGGGQIIMCKWGGGYAKRLRANSNTVSYNPSHLSVPFVLNVTFFFY